MPLRSPGQTPLRFPTAPAGARRRSRARSLLAPALAVAVTALMAAALVAAPPRAAAATVPRSALRAFSPRTLTPLYPVQSLNALAVAADGSGGLAYTASVAGVDHLFVARLADGTLQAPVELDASLTGPSSQPVLAAGPHGELLAAFINGGRLYVSDALDSLHQLSAPVVLAGQASNPALSLNRLGQGYLAFTQVSGVGSDVKAYFWGGAHWHLDQPEPLNVIPGDNAGAGAGRPAVIAAHDGVGLVAWGENGHVYARRVWNTMTSTETLQLDPADYLESGTGGAQTDWTWQSAGNPAVAADGDSTFLDIAFEETMSNGVTTANRVLLARVIAERLASVTAVDGLTTLGSQGGNGPQLVMNERGYGLVTDTAAAGGLVIGAPLGIRGGVLRPLAISAADPVGPDPIPVAEGGSGTMTVWAAPDAVDPSSPQVVFSYSQRPGVFSPITQISSAAAGPVDYADGLLAAGDGSGDGLIAWLQGDAGSETIHLGGVLVPPGRPATRIHRAITTRVRPILGWRPAIERFGSVLYTVTLDGRPIARTRRLSVRLRTRLTRGNHHWRVKATNGAGQSALSPIARLVVKRYHRRHRKHHHHRGRRRHHHASLVRHAVGAAQRPSRHPATRGQGR